MSGGVRGNNVLWLRSAPSISRFIKTPADNRAGIHSDITFLHSLGQYATSAHGSATSAIGVIPDIFKSYSEIDPPNVCFQGYSGPQFPSSPLPLWVNMRHRRMAQRLPLSV